jgi:hypothetical protein
VEDWGNDEQRRSADYGVQAVKEASSQDLTPGCLEPWRPVGPFGPSGRKGERGCSIVLGIRSEGRSINLLFGANFYFWIDIQLYKVYLVYII